MYNEVTGRVISACGRDTLNREEKMASNNPLMDENNSESHQSSITLSSFLIESVVHPLK
jgi:hypothetical protein